jgi:hypothetical protein
MLEKIIQQLFLIVGYLSDIELCLIHVVLFTCVNYISIMP